MQETKISIQDAFSQMSEGSSCSEAEPFALQCIDDSMEPEFAQGCIIIIDPEGIVRDGSYVFALDNNDEYIFRRLRIEDDVHTLYPLNGKYESFEISGLDRIKGVITQRAGRKKRTYHKWYDK